MATWMAAGNNFRKFGAIPVDRKGNSGQYDSVIEELKKEILYLSLHQKEDLTRQDLEQAFYLLQKN